MAIFQDGGRRHPGFNFGKFNGHSASRGSNCLTMPKFMAIGQTVAEIRRLFLDFSRWRLGFAMHMFRPPTKGI